MAGDATSPQQSKTPTEACGDLDEEGKTWRTLVPAGLQDLWRSVASGPQKCRQQGCKPAQDKKGKTNKNDGVGKEIGLIYGGSLILNTIIGPGIFTSPKGVLDGAGSVGMSLVIWVICGIFSTMAALCFAELRESVRKDGVEYAYITEAFGPLAGFVYCWMRIAAAEPVGTAVFAVALADYTADSIYDDCGPPGTLRKFIAVLAVVSLALLNVFSQKLADRMQILATVGKTCAIGVIIFYGIKNVIEGETQELQAGFSDTVTSPTRITFAFYNGLWAYGGWSNVNHVTSGLKKPPRNVPRLIKTVIPLVMVIYAMVVTSYFTVMSREDMLASEAIGVTWAERTLKGEAMAIIPIGVGLTALGSLNGTFLSAGRLSGVASKDKQMPEVTSWVHVRSKTPILTVYTRLAISIIMILVADIAELVRFFIFSVWLFHGMSVLALLVLRYKNKDKRRPYKVNLILPVIVVSVIAFLLIGPFLEEPRPEFISSIVLIVLSLVCYVPLHWVQSRGSLPDRFIIWLQLFFRIAPKRDLSRRKSIMRRMSSFALARNSFLIPATSPATIRRLQGSPALLRRMSRVSRMGAEGSPTIIRRVGRHRSLAEADLKRAGGSRVAWLETGQGGSPALVRRRPSRQAQSFSAADRVPRQRLASMPNLQILVNGELRRESRADTGNNTNHAASSKVSFSMTTPPPPSAPSSTSAPVIATRALPPGARWGSNFSSGVVNRGGNLSSAGGLRVPAPAPGPRLRKEATSTFHPGARRGSLDALREGGNTRYNNVNIPISSKRRNSSSQSLPAHLLYPPFSSSPFPSTIPEENDLQYDFNNFQRDPNDLRDPNNPRNPNDLRDPNNSRNPNNLRDPSNHRDDFNDRNNPAHSDLDADLDDDLDADLNDDLDVVGGFESEGGGEYEILSLPQLPLALALDGGDNSDSDDDSDDSDDYDLRGLGSLFDSTTTASSSDSDSSSSDINEEGSDDDTDTAGGRRGDGGYYNYSDDELDSDLDEIVFSSGNSNRDDDRTVSYI